MDRKLKILLAREVERQKGTVNLIASENYASADVLALLGSPLANKYSEGYPGRRYYPGNAHCDKIESLAREYALRLFGLDPEKWRANVQPYSGSPANFAVYTALLEAGDTIMGFELSSGGHLTHGHKVSLSGKLFRAVQYGLNAKTSRIDYRDVARLAKKHRPKMIISGLTAYPRAIDFKKFGAIAKSVGAYHMADVSHIAGLIAAKLCQSPFPYADAVTTTTHKMLRGPRGAIIFSRAEIADRVDRAVFPGLQGGPHNNATAAIAQSLSEALRPSYNRYAAQVLKNARALAEEFVALGCALVSGGTDNHLMLLDTVRSFGVDGLTAERLLEKNDITANRNSIPGDASPFKPSGVRLGTPAVTTRGMVEKDMRALARKIYAILSRRG
ncbi:MAG: serine hydroxymethyltransferase [Candidatus Colwellbacteria bacterium]|nr:serine hydroxymethyltransferase [Candidatus Colwellbacteria bacterium]